MNDILTTLQPWYQSIGAFCFFTIIRYHLQKLLLSVFCAVLNDKVSFSYGEDFLERLRNTNQYCALYYCVLCSHQPVADWHPCTM